MSEENKNSSPYGGRSGLSVWAENSQLAARIVSLERQLAECREKAFLAEQPSGREKMLKRTINRIAAERDAAMKPADRGEPDFLIDRDGEAWRRIGPDAYSVINASGLIEQWSRERIEAKWGPVVEAWK